MWALQDLLSRIGQVESMGATFRHSRNLVSLAFDKSLNATYVFQKCVVLPASRSGHFFRRLPVCNGKNAMDHPLLEAFGVDKLVDEGASIVENSSRLGIVLVLGLLALTAMRFALSTLQLLVSKVQPENSLSPFWRLAALAFLTANLYLRVTVVN